MFKKILITGGASRLGRIIAEHLHAQGFIVDVTYNTANLEGFEGIAATKLDLSDRKAVEIFARNIQNYDVLINNAAIFENDSISSYREPSLDRIMQVNAYAPIYLMQQMLKRNNVKVINILDKWASDVPNNFFSYTLSKTMLKTATISAGEEGNVFGIDLGFTLYNPLYPLHFFELMKKKYPSTPENLCDAIDFIVARDNLKSQIIDLTKWKKVY
ncbi:MAG: SDR family NAD(P)-dependent oxidoreductase [Alphaproteobacteria bacterium]|jgi:NAD(P)-dependent dehydrogenase (short-subunit alcohol dehydrogenase family)|nr:SDR family NAD(P)-dependent oxidoreductase [Candidatus Jidaibacter sp.]